MAISWEFYLSRRKVNLNLWLKTNSIRSYDDVVRTCAAKGVIPPGKDVYDSLIEPLLVTKASSNTQKPVSAKKTKASASKTTEAKGGSSSSVRKKPSPKKKTGDK